MGLITLLLFPIPTFVVLYYVEGITWMDVIAFDQLKFTPVFYGLLFGTAYAVLAIYFLKFPLFKKIPNKVEDLVRAMKLSPLDAFFLSLCAGIGEELLFRAGVQFYLGPLLTAIIFVAIHGYLNPFNWQMSLYGILVLPFILGLSYLMEYTGLWFCVAAHFSYDFLLFLSMSSRQKKEYSDSDENRRFNSF